jgi:hypothetical protein
MFKHRILSASLTVFAAVAISGVAHGSIINNTTISILGTSTAAYSGYPATDALDGGPNYQNTDYASNGGGASTRLDFDFGVAHTFTQILYTDRVTSGGGNGSFVGGLFDFVTAFDYVFADDASFTSIVGTVSVTRSAPSSPTSPADFLTTTSIPNYTARYLRWDVTAANGANPGASNFEFHDNVASSVPEPGTGLLAGVVLLLGVFTYRRTQERTSGPQTQSTPD